MDLIDLESLTVEERKIILNVIRRDEELQQRQDNRISQVKQEVHNLRMNSVLRNGDDLKKMCARCKTPFGFITNTGDVCPVCRFRVCKNCREGLITAGWLCTLCFKENQLRWLSGVWMDKDSDKSSFHSGTDLVRASLRVRHPNGNLGGLEERAPGHGSTNPLHHHQQRQQQQQQQQHHRARQTGGPENGESEKGSQLDEGAVELQTEGQSEPRTEHESDLQTENQSEAQAETETDPHAGVEPEPLAGVESEQRAEVDAEPHAGIECESQAEVEPKDEIESEPPAEIESATQAAEDSEPHAGIESALQAEVDSKPHAGTESEPHAEIESKPQAAVDSEPHAGTDSEPHAEIDSQPHAEIESKPQAGQEPTLETEEEADDQKTKTECAPQKEEEADGLPVATPDDSSPPEVAAAANGEPDGGAPLPSGPVQDEGRSEVPSILVSDSSADNGVACRDGRTAVNGHEQEEEEDIEDQDNTCADSAYSTAASSYTSDRVHHHHNRGTANKNHDEGSNNSVLHAGKASTDLDGKSSEGTSSGRDSPELVASEASNCAVSPREDSSRQIHDGAAAERDDKHDGVIGEEEEKAGVPVLVIGRAATDDDNTHLEGKQSVENLPEDGSENVPPEQESTSDGTGPDECSDDVDSSVYPLSKGSTASAPEESRNVGSPDDYSTIPDGRHVEEEEGKRSKEGSDLPFTMQRYFLVDDALSDTLSIISERTEPGERTDREEDEDEDTRFSDDSDSTVHDVIDEAWSDDEADDGELENGSSTPRRTSVDGTHGEPLAHQTSEDGSVGIGILPPGQASGHPEEESLAGIQHDAQGSGVFPGSSEAVPEVEVSSTQTEEVFIITHGEKAKVQDFIRHMVVEALPRREHTAEDGSVGEQTADVQDLIQQVVGAVSRSTSQEDASSQTEDVRSDIGSEHSQDLEQHDERQQMPGSTGVFLSHMEIFILEHERQDQMRLATNTALPATNDGAFEEVEGSDKARKDGAIKEKEMAADLGSSPVGASTHDEAIFLDQGEPDETDSIGTDHQTRSADGDDDVHYTHDVKQTASEDDTRQTIEGAEHTSEEHGPGLAAGRTANDAESEALNNEHFQAHRAYVDHANEERSPQLSHKVLTVVSEIGEPAPPDNNSPAVSKDDPAHLSVTANPHSSSDSETRSQRDSDADSIRRALALFDAADTESEEHPPDFYVPEATLDLDDPNQECSDSSSLVAPGGWVLSGPAGAVQQEASPGQFSDDNLLEGGAAPPGDDGLVDFPSGAEGDDSLLDVPDLPGAHEAEVQYVPTINQSLHLDGDGDHSDGGAVSPGLRPNSTTPKRGSPHRLSTPSMVTSHASSLDEKKSGEGTDDENIDELFAQHRTGSRLGISRSSIGSPTKSTPKTAEPASNLTRQKAKGVPSSRESLASVYSDAGEINYGRIPVSGDITFALEYDHKNSALKIKLKGCHDLAPVDIKHNRSDPYVKVYLLPDKTRSGKRKSKIKKHTLNPVYDEVLSYNISHGELENRVLWVTVWHSDRFGRNDFLGEVTIPMDMHRFSDTGFNTYTLESRVPDTLNEEVMQYKGDLLISLIYITPDNVTENKKSKSKSKSKKSKSATEPQGEIQVLIKEAKNLTAVRSNGTSDPFVKGYLLPDRGRNAKQKTTVMKNSVNPAWNYTLVFDGVDPMELADRCLELTIWDHEKLGTNEFLGGARLNLGMGAVKGGHQVDWMDARGEESITWQSMLERPNTWIDAKLPLRASMGKSSKK